MFDPAAGARLFALPPGCDYPAELIRGMEQRLEGQPPEAWAEIEIFVNTTRMRRRLMRLFADGPPRLLPRIRLLGQLAADPAVDLPPALPSLDRKLDLARLVLRLIEADPTLAPRSAVFDLADSLGAVFDEMYGEGVDPAALEGLDVGEMGGHWQRALKFLMIARQVAETDALPSPEARLRRAAEALAARWAAAPPSHPVIVAGSTGSRGPVALLMEAVARLPQGAVVLPGVDPHMPADVWDRLGDARTGEDHPQFRFAAICQKLGRVPWDLPRWTGCDPVPARSALLSMALRPAPVTDQWMRDGPALGDMVTATEGLSLIEAADPVEEAQSIAIRLRRAADEGRRTALITPDRTLTRRVQAALDRWGIEADDSAGEPLHLTPPGRLLRQTARLLGEGPGPDAVLALLKHPLVSHGDRGVHLRNANALDLWLRDNGGPSVDSALLTRWTEAKGADPNWATWIGGVLDRLAATGAAHLPALVARHMAEVQALSPDLWSQAAGRKAREVMAALEASAGHGGPLRPSDYVALLDSLLQAEESRRPDTARPDIMIWGTLEARVQGADLVILAGLSEGTWPEPPTPDPWLNRDMRARVGLLLPERRIGLSAHDFQQAACAPEVVFSRARRDAEAETVMSRWLNRLTNLLGGLPDNRGPEALAAMRARGDLWLNQARLSAARVDRLRPAHRPSPRPPVDVRPNRLSVTQIEKLVRDPYGIYAANVLKLRPLSPRRPEPDGRQRGQALHRILELWLIERHDPATPAAREALLRIATEVLAQVQWASARLTWLAQVEGWADWFLEGERTRQAEATPLRPEEEGRFEVPGTGVLLTGTADRIDRRTDGRLNVIDYKTGRLPSKDQLLHFDKQLMLEAVMAEAGAFRGVDAAEVATVSHIGLGSDRKETLHDLREAGDVTLDPRAVLLMLQKLLGAYNDRAQGYTSLRATERQLDRFDYAHLARFGEWDLSDPAQPEDVG
ncbi:Inactivated superfamily I helicase [Palleronia marisminoris]|uniref:PD-(D/E)XK nuclease superfamily protein n=1 Tax=Palleronia marisminoris TaxID=315423 RepID=A0A1Y5SYN7_9RHOB|nr:PD-(D/E)XK nuclease family protein [Palleronia marisminoris]SFH07241.1 Inactivated superfamily I helicase [Palleronia marisminoris]SLN51784.1 PD-(D/E)XK nuclease superfamily protein [Palleronia marisminoris]